MDKRISAIRATLDGACPLLADCSQMSVYSSPRVCTAARVGQWDGIEFRVQLTSPNGQAMVHQFYR